MSAGDDDDNDADDDDDDRTDRAYLVYGSGSTNVR